MAFIKLFSYHYARHRRHVHLTVAGMLVIALVTSLVATFLPYRNESSAAVPYYSVVWEKLTPGSPPSARSDHSAVALNGKMYMFGGYNPSYLNGLFEYDPVGNAWTQKSPTGGPPVARANHSAVALNGKMYMFGGLSSGSYLNDLWEYDPVGNTWTPKALIGGSGRYGHSAVALNGKMYVFGGVVDPIGTVNDLWEYDPAGNSWTQKTPTGAPAGFNSHSAVALNGKMYVFGGYGKTIGINNQLWEYDPVGNSWTQKTPTGTPPSQRSSPQSATVINNKMYVFGGMNPSGTGLNDLFEYDPAVNSWSEIKPTYLPSKRYGHSAVAINGKMYVFGGYAEGYVNQLWTMSLNPTADFTANPTQTVATSLAVTFTDSSTANSGGSLTAWQWDFDNNGTIDSTQQNPSYTYANPGMYTVSLTVTDSFGQTGKRMKDDYIIVGDLTPIDTWGQITNATGTSPGTVQDSAVMMSGKMYVMGGICNQLFTYNPQTNAWATLSPTGGCSTQNWINHASTVINGKIYVFGGRNSDGTNRNSIWEYDPIGNNWTQKSPTGGPPLARELSSSAAINGKMYVFGGYSSSGGTNWNDLWEYDPAGNNWTQKTSATLSRQLHSAVAINGKMYVFGGYNSSNGAKFSDLWEYDPAVDSWTQKTSATASRYNHSAVAIAGKMYVFGGVNSSGSTLNDLWEYDPIGNSWTQKSPTGGLPAARYNPSAVALNGRMYVHGGSSGTLTDLWGFYKNHVPLASFTANPVSGTSPLDVTFTDTSVDDPLDIVFGSVTAWSWDFNNDGAADSNAQNPTYPYGVTGCYSVKLTATDGGTLQNTKVETGFIDVGNICLGTGGTYVRLSVIKEVSNDGDANPSDGVISSPGQDVQYKITVTNWGSKNAEKNYKITDILPPGFTNPRTFAGANPAAPVIAGRKLVWDLAPAQNPLLKNGGTLVITYTVDAP